MNAENKKDRPLHAYIRPKQRKKEGDSIILYAVFQKIYKLHISMLASPCTRGLAPQSAAFPSTKRVLLTVTFKSTLQP